MSKRHIFHVIRRIVDDFSSIVLASDGCDIVQSIRLEMHHNGAKWKWRRTICWGECNMRANSWRRQHTHNTQPTFELYNNGKRLHYFTHRPACTHRQSHNIATECRYALLSASPLWRHEMSHIFRANACVCTLRKYCCECRNAAKKKIVFLLFLGRTIFFFSTRFWRNANGKVCDPENRWSRKGKMSCIFFRHFY